MNEKKDEVVHMLHEGSQFQMGRGDVGKSNNNCEQPDKPNSVKLDSAEKKL